jgi:hypothetical protein
MASDSGMSIKMTITGPFSPGTPLAQKRLARRGPKAQEVSPTAQQLFAEMTRVAQQAEALERQFSYTYGWSEARLQLLSHVQLISAMNFDMAAKLRTITDQIAREAEDEASPPARVRAVA